MGGEGVSRWDVAVGRRPQETLLPCLLEMGVVRPMESAEGTDVDVVV